MTTLHIDFETRSTVDLRKTGVHAYAEDASTAPWCMAWAIDDRPTELWDADDFYAKVHLWRAGEAIDLFEALMSDDTVIVAHNAQFELQIWNRIMVPRYGWPALDAKQVRCTMTMAYALALPGSLENAAAAVGLELRKDMQGRNLMLKMSRPRRIDPDGTLHWWDTPENLEKLHDYCKNDVEVERLLEQRLMPLIDSEQDLWVLDQEINDRGIHVDIPAIDRAMEIVEEAKKRLDREMKRVTGGWVSGCTKVGDLTDWLRLHGVEVDGVAKADVTELLARDDLPEACRQALLLRRDAAKSSTAKLKAMRQGASRDGRCKGTLQYHGASTGRWASRRAQFQNVPRSSMPYEEILEVLDLLGGDK